MSHIIISTSPTHSGKAEQMLEGTGCTEIYETFELCLADNDRSFKICKEPMMLFRKCMDDWGLKKHNASKARVAKGETTTESW